MPPIIISSWQSDGTRLKSGWASSTSSGTYAPKWMQDQYFSHPGAADLPKPVISPLGKPCYGFPGAPGLSVRSGS
jgi:hypothetical protein